MALEDSQRGDCFTHGCDGGVDGLHLGQNLEHQTHVPMHRRRVGGWDGVRFLAVLSLLVVIQDAALGRKQAERGYPGSLCILFSKPYENLQLSQEEKFKNTYDKHVASKVF